MLITSDALHLVVRSCDNGTVWLDWFASLVAGVKAEGSSAAQRYALTGACFDAHLNSHQRLRGCVVKYVQSDMHTWFVEVHLRLPGDSGRLVYLQHVSTVTAAKQATY